LKVANQFEAIGRKFAAAAMRAGVTR